MNADLRAQYEQQATDCLEAASRHQPKLLAVACKLAGSAEGGMDLFQQACLSCHDTIQRRGFTGGRYEFYLLAALKNLHYGEARRQRRTVALPEDFEPAPEGPAPTDAYAQLAEQVVAEARARFTPAERILLRLHADGCSCQQISQLTGNGQDRRRVWEQLERLKATLRGAFQQAWDALGE